MKAEATNLYRYFSSELFNSKKRAFEVVKMSMFISLEGEKSNNPDFEWRLPTMKKEQ